MVVDGNNILGTNKALKRDLMSVTWLNLSFPLNHNFQIACAMYKGQRLFKVGMKYFFLVLRKSVSGTNFTTLFSVST